MVLLAVVVFGYFCADLVMRLAGLNRNRFHSHHKRLAWKMPSQGSKGGKTARSRGLTTPLPKKSSASAESGSFCGCPKQQLYLAGVAFCVVYTLAFLSVR